MQDSINQNLETRPQAKKIGMKQSKIVPADESQWWKSVNDHLESKSRILNKKKKKKKKKNGARKIKLASQCQTKHIHDNRQSKLKIWL